MGSPARRSSSTRCSLRTLWPVLSGLAVAFIALTIAVGGLILVSRSFSGVSLRSSGKATPDPGPSVSQSVIPGPDVPFPPAIYGFGSTNYSSLIDAPVNAYLLVQNQSGDPL